MIGIKEKSILKILTRILQFKEFVVEVLKDEV